MLASVTDLPDRSGEQTSARRTVSLLVEGWPDDLRTCVEALGRAPAARCRRPGLDLGNVDGAGDVLHELAQAHPAVVEELHVERPAGWAQARTALLKHDIARVHIWLDPSTVLEGDALPPILDDVRRPDGRRRRLAGSRSSTVDDRGARSSTPGRARSTPCWVTCSRSAAERGSRSGGPHPKARFYRNADMEFSLLLREAGGRLVVPAGDLPVRQDRHRGYHDSDPDYRDAESAKTYQRLLQRFRGKEEILAPQSEAD